MKSNMKWVKYTIEWSYIYNKIVAIIKGER